MNVRATKQEFAPLSRGASGPRRRGCGTAANPFDLTRFVKLTLRRDLQPQPAFGLKIGTPARINSAGRHTRALVRLVVVPRGEGHKAILPAGQPAVCSKLTTLREHRKCPGCAVGLNRSTGLRPMVVQGRQSRRPRGSIRCRSCVAQGSPCVSGLLEPCRLIARARLLASRARALPGNHP
jgi:hypothetical protein